MNSRFSRDPQPDERARLSALLQRHGLRTNKALGQHFLVDDDILSGIAHSLDPGPDTDVIEIGSGAGNLSLMLALSGARVTGLELDRRYTPVHQEILLTRTDLEGRLQFAYSDAMEFDFAAAAQAAHAAGRRFMIAGNIPYQITSPLIMRILETGTAFDCMVLMMQREVAERLAARPGGRTIGSISLKVQYYTEVELLMEVPPEAFLPPPEVHSTVVRFSRRDGVTTERPGVFDVIDAAYTYRRKTVGNSIANAGLGYTRGQVEAAMGAVGIAQTTRAEQLSLEQFQALEQALRRQF